MNPTRILTFFTLLISLTFAACDESSPSGQDTTSGDTAEGDTTTNDVPEGDTTSDDTAEGDTTADVPEGDTTTGDVPKGDISVGDITNDDTAEGDTTADTQGDTTADTQGDTATGCEASVTGAPTGGPAAAGRFSDFGGGLQYVTTSADPASGPVDRLSIEFYFGTGAVNGPHTVTYDGTNYSECSDCVLAGLDCSAPVREFTACTTTFLIQSGELEVTAMETVGGSFTGTLRNATFIEVEIDPSSYVATPVENGQTWCIDEHNIDVAVVEFSELP